MIDANDKLLFNTSPSALIAGVTFESRVVVQYIDTPMVEIVQEVTSLNTRGYTTQIPIYYNDGTKLAVVKGARLHATSEGKKVGGCGYAMPAEPYRMRIEREADL